MGLERWIYSPSRFPEETWKPNRHTFVPLDLRIRTLDGLCLHGWFLDRAGADRSLLYFHGSGGNITDRAPMLDLLSRLPLSILIFDYRGFGRSEGSPSEEGIRLDADAAVRHLWGSLGADPGRSVFFGESLGGAVAAEAALRHPCGGLILQSSLTDGWDMAKVRAPWLPSALVRRLCRNQFDARSAVAQLRIPKLFVRGANDRLVPRWMSTRLFDSAAPPKASIEVPGFAHDNFECLGDSYVEALRSFLSGMGAHAEPHRCPRP